VLYTVAAMDLFAAFLAVVALRPVLAAHVARSGVVVKETLPDDLGEVATARA
jgi:OFA family oxalate/formate antiporter-like MFS transporter